jgi:hypothetical protein
MQGGSNVVHMYWFKLTTFLVIDHKPKVVMDYFPLRYTLKPGSMKEPDMYLRSQISKFFIEGAEHPEKT